MLTIYYVERTITAGYVPLFLIRWKFPDGTKRKYATGKQHEYRYVTQSNKCIIMDKVMFYA